MRNFLLFSLFFMSIKSLAEVSPDVAHQIWTGNIVGLPALEQNHCEFKGLDFVKFSLRCSWKIKETTTVKVAFPLNSPFNETMEWDDYGTDSDTPAQIYKIYEGAAEKSCRAFKLKVGQETVTLRSKSIGGARTYARQGPPPRFECVLPRPLPVDAGTVLAVDLEMNFAAERYSVGFEDILYESDMSDFSDATAEFHNVSSIPLKLSLDLDFYRGFVQVNGAPSPKTLEVAPGKSIKIGRPKELESFHLFLGAPYPLKKRTARASDQLEPTSDRYAAANVIDGKSQTAWCVPRGLKKNPWIEIQYDKPWGTPYMKVTNGYWKSPSTLENNAQPAAIGVSTCGSAIEPVWTTFKKQDGLALLSIRSDNFALRPPYCLRVTFKVDSIKKDFCVSEILVEHMMAPGS